MGVSADGRSGETGLFPQARITKGEELFAVTGNFRSSLRSGEGRESGSAERERHRDYGSAFQRAFDEDVAAMRIHNLFGDGETKACAPVLGGEERTKELAP